MYSSTLTIPLLVAMRLIASPVLASPMGLSNLSLPLNNPGIRNSTSAQNVRGSTSFLDYDDFLKLLDDSYKTFSTFDGNLDSIYVGFGTWTEFDPPEIYTVKAMASATETEQAFTNYLLHYKFKILKKRFDPPDERTEFSVEKGIPTRFDDAYYAACKLSKELKTSGEIDNEVWLIRPTHPPAGIDDTLFWKFTLDDDSVIWVGASKLGGPVYVPNPNPDQDLS